MRLLMCIMFLLLSAHTATAADSPNIVLIYIDDWAWNGSPVMMDDDIANSFMPVLNMPNLEQLAADGMKFSRAYGSPQCTPGRASVLTGQSNARNKLTVYMNDRGQSYFNLIGYPHNPVKSVVADMVVDVNAMTIPKALEPLGYISAHLGKWHLRSNPADYGYAIHDGDTNNTPGNQLGSINQIPDDFDDPKLMFSLTERAVDFIDTYANQKPFYLQISHWAMHAGSECLATTRNKYTTHPAVQEYYRLNGETAETVRRKSDPAVWLGMGEDLDNCIGIVLDKLDTMGIADNTYVVVVADNGYRHSFYPNHTQPLHARKWWVWQGGIRVPMIISGPTISAGSVFQENVVNYDLLPTFVSWAGGDPASLPNIDGVDLSDYVAGTAPGTDFTERNIYFHYPHYRETLPHSAVIAGDYKMMHFYEQPDVPMLFDITADIGERINIFVGNESRHSQMYTDMMNYFAVVGARVPEPNPDFIQAEYEQLKKFQERMDRRAFHGTRPLFADEIAPSIIYTP